MHITKYRAKRPEDLPADVVLSVRVRTPTAEEKEETAWVFEGGIVRAPPEAMLAVIEAAMAGLREMAKSAREAMSAPENRQ